MRLSSGLDMPLTGDALPSRWARLGASIVDEIAVSVVALVIAAVIDAGGLYDLDLWPVALLGGSMDPSLFALLALPVSAANEVLGLGERGRSLGKAVLGLRVADVRTAVEIGSRAAMIRWALKAVLVLVPFAGSAFGLVDTLCVFRSDRRAIHDHVSGTVVLRS